MRANEVAREDFVVRPDRGSLDLGGQQNGHRCSSGARTRIHPRPVFFPSPLYSHCLHLSGLRFFLFLRSCSTCGFSKKKFVIQNVLGEAKTPLEASVGHRCRTKAWVEHHLEKFSKRRKAIGERKKSTFRKRRSLRGYHCVRGLVCNYDILSGTERALNWVSRWLPRRKEIGN